MTTLPIACKRISVGDLCANCYILWCRETRKSIIVDPGDESKKILEIVKQLSLEPCSIVNTHAHFDHTGANGAIKAATGAELLIHSEDVALLEQQSRHAAVWGIRYNASPPPDRLLEDGDEIQVGKVTAQVIHTPGHSPGGLCLWIPGLVLTGDTLFQESIGRTDLPGGDHATLIESITERLLVLGDDTLVLPGHGEETTIGHERRSNPFL